MIRLALIGCPGELARYARIAPRLRGAHFAAIADRDGRRANQCAQLLDANVWTDDCDRLLKEHAASFDAVVLRDSSPQCIALCRAAIRAGKHVLLQGPLPDSAATMTQLVAACDGAGVRLMVGNSLRYMPSVRTVKQCLDSGRLGEPACLRMHCWSSSEDTEPQVAPGSSPASFASGLLCRHFGEVDAACWLFDGAPTVVYSTGFRGTGSEVGRDYVQLHLGFGEDGMALIDVAHTLPTGDAYFSLTLVGTSGAAYADDHNNMQLQFTGGRPAAIGGSQEDQTLRGELQEFTQAITEGREPLLTGTDGLRAIKVIEAAGESLIIRQAMHRVSQQERNAEDRAGQVPRFVKT